VSADGKPPSSSSPGRPPADTPQRIGVGSESMGLGDTGIASSAVANTPTLAAGDDETPKRRPNTSSELIGSTLSGRYLVTKKIGQGGMGAVYEATHTLIGKRVAVKVLLEKYAQREAIVARLKQEAQLASSIGNEHIIDITDIGNTDDGRTFVVMEYLEGESLAECLSREHELPEQRILRIATQAASALAAAHAKGIVHRDIKPENLFLLKRKDQDFVKVVDFGISKSLRASGPGEDEEAQRLTQTGMVLGTPLYMSPEQARGDDDLDHRVDIYALGVIMYESVAGHVPFVGSNYLSVISQVLNEVPKPLREIRPDVSEELEAIVAKAMAKNRNDRYRDADAMLEDLGALAADPTHSTERARITGPRRRFPKAPAIPRAAWAVGGLGVVIAGVTLAVVYLQGNGGEKERKKQHEQELAAKQIHDGGVAVVAPPADAEPTFQRITLHIDTVPAGAELERESQTLGIAPQPVIFVLRDKEVEVTAHLDGYLDANESVNPVEHADGDTIVLKLKKLPKGVPQPPHIVPKSGSANPQPNHTAGGELGGYPGGIVPNK
jgi:tRNA A-37 threonylcarbamoyl transferase component Bud32